MALPPMTHRRRLAGAVLAVVAAAVVTAAMLPVRSHLDVTAVALVYVVPVVLAAAVGGFVAGILAVAACFAAYDFFFIRPYLTMDVSRSREWAVLAVYVVVMVLVSRVVDVLWRTEASSQQAERDTAHLFEVSQLFVGERSSGQLFEIVVNTVREAFDLSAVVLLLPRGDGSSRAGGFEMAAQAGRPVTAGELEQLTPSGGSPATLRATAAPVRNGAKEAEELETIVLAVQERPLGLLGIIGPPLPRQRRELLTAFANHVSLAIERATLRDQALKVQLLEQIDRHRRYLFGAVSHDLRTPLATIKASASALLHSSAELSDADRAELASLIEAQSDRLGRVVSNLLDMTRIQAGALVLDRRSVSVEEIVEAVLDALGPAAERVRTVLPSEPILLQADRTLLVEALVNLAENALRYSPNGVPIEIAAETSALSDRVVCLTVSDRGPGMPADLRIRLNREREVGIVEERSRSGSGLGLSIARAFLEAHGGTLRLEDAGPGTVAVAELPLGPRPDEHDG